MGSTTGHRIDYNKIGVGEARGTYPAKIDPSTYPLGSMHTIAKWRSESDAMLLLRAEVIDYLFQTSIFSGL